MKDLKEGHVPKEIRKNFKGKTDVAVANYLDEEYEAEEKKEDKKAEKKVQAFAGKGVALSSVKSITMEVNEIPPPKVDKKKEVTKVNVRLHTGKTINIEVNVDMKVRVIYDYVAKVAPVKGIFNLMESGFPPKKIENLSQTVGQAGLKSSTIIQKLT
eukprot:TRINITY_DN751_c0_g2_i2.p1 TRINITY_DN751_c0_g2~~TRINITY_DN751_c0_g2_i2.p1  ORF type:complete len:157 (+),score=53.86 TRINITY_DN751_c0_g2_i2:370-840(+)